MPPIADVDPFDLPEWLGTARRGLARRRRPARPGTWCRPPDRGGRPPTSSCDLLAVDEAYPAPVADDATRLRAHQAWRHGQVLLGVYDERLTLAVPGTASTPSWCSTPWAGWPRRWAPRRPLRGPAADRATVAPVAGDAGRSCRG